MTTKINAKGRMSKTLAVTCMTYLGSAAAASAAAVSLNGSLSCKAWSINRLSSKSVPSPSPSPRTSPNPVGSNAD